MYLQPRIPVTGGEPGISALLERMRVRLRKYDVTTALPKYPRRSSSGEMRADV
jgi:hypothetical protein